MFPRVSRGSDGLLLPIANRCITNTLELNLAFPPLNSRRSLGAWLEIPIRPLGITRTVSLLEFKNLIVSSLLVGKDSALIYVSWFVSLTPPRDPQALPAPYPSNVFISMLYLI